jgi:hypothetical protein
VISSRAAVIVCLGLLAACPHHPPGGGGQGTGVATGSGTAAPPVDAGPRVVVAGQPILPADGVACPALGCVYHAGASAYYACLSGGAGICFHFGAPCEPADHCMFDAGDGKYKTCSTAVEGACTAWGAACEPASACMFDPTDGMHHHCDAAKDGACTQWGDLCDPG